MSDKKAALSGFFGGGEALFLDFEFLLIAVLYAGLRTGGRDTFLVIQTIHGFHPAGRWLWRQRSKLFPKILWPRKYPKKATPALRGVLPSGHLPLTAPHAFQTRLPLSRHPCLKPAPVPGGKAVTRVVHDTRPSGYCRIAPIFKNVPDVFVT
ncbi:hypothetical protein [Gallaecimonas mangrovi]|uniref:hypothetical protein n=1 Tax=Gallaecimonas mangrovi TaxID=2291597 RepID=UPI0012601463|nr:hypothetical protein [Gallaecimonas mangrovi]